MVNIFKPDFSRYLCLGVFVWFGDFVGFFFHLITGFLYLLQKE